MGKLKIKNGYPYWLISYRDKVSNGGTGKVRKKWLCLGKDYKYLPYYIWTKEINFDNLRFKSLDKVLEILSFPSGISLFEIVIKNINLIKFDDVECQDDALKYFFEGKDLFVQIVNQIPPKRKKEFINYLNFLCNCDIERLFKQ
jgi:hypothetical protein